MAAPKALATLRTSLFRLSRTINRRIWNLYPRQWIIGPQKGAVMDHMQAIRAFTRVVETGGFTRAADSLQMPNATGSKQIQQLESQLGLKLVESTKRRAPATRD